MTDRPASRAFLRPLTTALMVTLAVLITAGSCPAGQEETESRSKGRQCLFAGHSFFVPVALSFDRIARRSDFPEHDIDVVFRGGQSGTAGAMWISPSARKAVTEVLETGEVEVFGLTPGLTDNAETFERWFDLALEHNPDTHFFVGIPWAIGGHGMDTKRFDGMIDGYAAMGGAVVEELRKRYPDNRIDYIAYGKIAPAMKRRFESGELSDITMMVGKGPDALFSDNRLGHAGPMLLDLCALTWFEVIYGAKLDSLNLDEHQADVPAIIAEVMAFNAPFKADPSKASDSKGEDDADMKTDEQSDSETTAPTM